MLNHGAVTALQAYGQSINAVPAQGQAMECGDCLSLQQLLECVGGQGLRILNEPTQVACGAPDLVVERDGVTIGYVACIDTTDPLDQVGATGRLGRYRHGLANVILTNHVEFCWYVEGKQRQQVCLGYLDRQLGFQIDPTAFEALKTLLHDFLCTAPVVTDRSEALAQTMAAKTRLLQDAIVCVLVQDKGTGALHDLWKVYCQALITNLSAEDFADLQAQTTVYGLFAARCEHPTGVPFTRQSAILTKNTPFLKDIFNHITGPEIDERITWIIDDLTCLLNQANMAAVLEDFRQRSQREDPVMHFYEDFLKAYNPETKEICGVYYTPEPVVSYIVRSVDKLLQDRLGLPGGLAEMPGPGKDHRVFILDPAVGTGTFLREVIAQIRATLERQGLASIWPRYIKQHLLPRLLGFELLMAPYAIGYLNLARELGDEHQGLQLGPDQHLNVFLTNTLQDGHQRVEDVLLAHTTAHEAANTDEVRQGESVIVVIGNPPYSGHSANKNPWIDKLLRGQGEDGSKGSYFHVDGQPLRERNMKWLNDDYVKFIRFAQWLIEETGAGVLAFVTNHSYLDSPTFRGMRCSLMETFDDLYLLDLHGNTRRQEKTPDGSKDMNIFDIQQGVAIGFFIKHGKGSGERTKNVFWAERWGERDTGPSGGKYGWLAANTVETTPWRRLAPHAPSYLFVPCDEKREKEYEKGYKLTDIFLERSVGIVTARDRLSIQFDISQLRKIISDFSEREVEDARQTYNLGKDTRDWSVQRAQQDLKDHLNQDQHIIRILYRPFDQRFTYYTGRGSGFICKPRRKVMKCMLDDSNLALCIGRAGQATGSKQWDVVLVSDKPTDLNLFRRGGNCLFPLYRYLASKDFKVNSAKKHNLNPSFVKASSAALALEFVPDGPGNLVTSFGPEDILHSIYAVLHSPAYRQRYQDHLKSDFPVLPLISSKTLFAELVHLGQQLVILHRLKIGIKDYEAPTFPHYGDNTVESVSYTPPQDGHPGKVWVNTKQYFYGVAPEVWNFTIGGYAPAHKWLKERKGHVLLLTDINCYCRICAALAATSHLMARIDEIIAAYGDWPLA